MSNFKVRENPNKEQGLPEFFIEITEGELKDVLFVFGKIQNIDESEESGEAHLTFEYDLHFVPEHITINDEVKSKIDVTVGNILQQILMDAYNRELNSDEDRNHDSE
jgi:hypothetical protein